MIYVKYVKLFIDIAALSFKKVWLFFQIQEFQRLTLRQLLIWGDEWAQHMVSLHRA